MSIIPRVMEKAVPRRLAVLSGVGIVSPVMYVVAK